MKNIYFVQNEEEYKKAISKGLRQSEIYFIQAHYPYFSDTKQGIWDDVVPSINNSYWLRHYKEIDMFVDEIVRCSNMEDAELLHTDYFKFDIVWELGKYFMYPINLLNQFFTFKKPCILHYNSTNNFISSTLEAVTNNHDVEIKKI